MEAALFGPFIHTVLLMQTCFSLLSLNQGHAFAAAVHTCTHIFAKVKLSSGLPFYHRSICEQSNTYIS